MGSFVWNNTTDQWFWDAGMFGLHGYPVGGVRVDTQLVLRHKATEHRAHAAVVLTTSAREDQTFSNYHSIVDVKGHRRTVLTVGESRTDATRPTPSHRFSRGFMVDVTQDEHDSTRAAVRQARRNTAPIQQSLGLLMGSLGLTEDAAFGLVRRVSQLHNVAVKDLAREFMAAAVSGAAGSDRNLVEILVRQAAALAVERADPGVG